MDETNVDALAVCIGNVHGKYPPGGPYLRLDLLKVEKFEFFKSYLVSFSLFSYLVSVLTGASSVDYEKRSPLGSPWSLWSFPGPCKGVLLTLQ